MLRSKYVRMELLKLTDDQLDALCSDAQDAAEETWSLYDRLVFTDLAGACADILEDRRVIPSSWNAFYSPEDGTWLLLPAT